MQQTTAKKKKSGGRSVGWEWTPPPKLAQKYFTCKQAAAELGCCERQLRKIIRAEQLTVTRYNGKFLLVLRASVAMYIAEKSGEGLPPAAATKKAKQD